MFTWIAFAIWPLPSPKNPDPEVARHDNPVLAAALGVAIVLPVMLIYLMLDSPTPFPSCLQSCSS